MLIYRPAAQRGQVKLGWLDSRHTFSFGHYYDPAWMGFGPLRVINEDRVAPGGGFAPHSHANMEIISVVLDGALEHKDSIGTGSIIRPGDVQRMSAGHGIEHSEFNASKSHAVHFLQIWIQPDRVNSPPSYAQQAFSSDPGSNQLQLVVSPDGADGSLTIWQNARLYRLQLDRAGQIEHTIASGRRIWLQMIAGAVQVNGQTLNPGDGLGLVDESLLTINATDAAQALVFDLP